MVKKDKFIVKVDFAKASWRNIFEYFLCMIGLPLLIILSKIMRKEIIIFYSGKKKKVKKK